MEAQSVGYCYDEKDSNENETLTLDELKDALSVTSQKFDFVGFDACLMATIETAYALKDSANYLIASEETEPGTGWDYNTLLGTLSKSTGQDTARVGKAVVDSFIYSNNSFWDFTDATLSVISLNKIDNAFKKLEEFAIEIKNEDLDKNNFSSISKAAGRTKTFGDEEIDTFDLVDFATQVDNSKSEELIKAVKEAIVYNKTTDLVTNANGMSIYFPYSALEYYAQMTEVFPRIGISDKYIGVLTQFANIIAGGQNSSYTFNGNRHEVESDYSMYDWYDQDYINSYSNYYDQTTYDDSEDLEIVDKGDYYALELSDEDWEIISSIECQVFYDNGEGYVDLGTDNYYELDDDDNLKIEFNGDWIAINGQIVNFEVVEENDVFTKGRTVAYLNDELVYLIINWKNDQTEGKIVSVEPYEGYGNTTLSGKRGIKLKEGDKLTFAFDFYTYEGEYKDILKAGSDLIIEDPSDLKTEYMEIDNKKFYVYYKIIDIYGNTYYTEAIEY